MFCFVPMMAQTLMFYTLEGGVTSVALPATFTLKGNGDALVIDGDGLQVNVPKDRILAVSYNHGDGDVNVDGVVNVADIATIVDIMAGNPVSQSGDASSGAVGRGLSSVPLPATLTFTSVDGALIAKSGSQQASLAKNRIFGVVYRSDNGGKVDVADIAIIMAGETVAPDVVLPPGVEAVDLGLPSGTKWANMNVGATSPEGFGLYFAWGETVGYGSKTNDGRAFDWGSYKWMAEGKSSADNITKYQTDDKNFDADWYDEFEFIGDGKTILDMEDDAAHANWGGAWRMPTEAEMQELVDNTTSEWTTLNGIRGRRFTSKSNGNSIFLPAAGYRRNNWIMDTSSYGNYWTSTIVEKLPFDARNIHFNSEEVAMYGTFRSYALTVRPVK